MTVLRLQGCQQNFGQDRGCHLRGDSADADLHGTGPRAGYNVLVLLNPRVWSVEERRAARRVGP